MDRGANDNVALVGALKVSHLIASLKKICKTNLLHLETARFYRALSMLGTNFSLMEKLFHNRPRVELKRKFKTEEKINPQLVDKIISRQIPFDPDQFLDLDGIQ